MDFALTKVVFGICRKKSYFFGAEGYFYFALAGEINGSYLAKVI